MAVTPIRYGVRDFLLTPNPNQPVHASESSPRSQRVVDHLLIPKKIQPLTPITNLNPSKPFEPTTSKDPLTRHKHPHCPKPPQKHLQKRGDGLQNRRRQNRSCCLCVGRSRWSSLPPLLLLHLLLLLGCLFLFLCLFLCLFLGCLRLARFLGGRAEEEGHRQQRTEEDEADDDATAAAAATGSKLAPSAIRSPFR